MWGLFDILRYSVSSIFWGGLLAALCVALFVFLIRGWYKDAAFSPMSYVAGAALFILLGFQCTMAVGALKIISLTGEYEEFMTEIVEDFARRSDAVGDGLADAEEIMGREATSGQSDELIKEVIDSYPILCHYISGADFRCFTLGQLPGAMMEELRSVMRWYVFRRAMWSLGFAVVAAIVVIKTMNMGGTPRMSPYRDGRGQTAVPRAADRRAGARRSTRSCGQRRR